MGRAGAEVGLADYKVWEFVYLIERARALVQNLG